MEKQMYRKFNKYSDKLSKCCRPGGARGLRVASQSANELYLAYFSLDV